MTPETFEQGIKIMQTQALPSFRLMDGFKGALIFADENAAKAVFISLWGSEEEMRRNEEEVATIRDDSAEVLAVEEIPVERYEVRLLDFEGAG
jgi:hypothetical protein